MGRSDQHVFSWYARQMPRAVESVAFLGTPRENAFTESVHALQRDFFDLSLGNWEIDSPWGIRQSAYDLVVCTRCAYFSADPGAFIKKCLAITRSGGTVFVDWGLGDHWRFPMYKVGWRRNGEQESVTYGEHVSKLNSCYWDDRLESDPNVIMFRSHVARFGYDYSMTLGDIIRQEVPAILRPNSLGPSRVSTLFLWPEAPQLYISTSFVKDPD